MTRQPVSLGYFLPRPDRIEARPWSVRAGDQQLAPSATTVPGWDWFTPLHVERDLIVDIDGLRDDCGLGNDAVLQGVFTWHSSLTNIRGVSTTPVTADSTTLRLEPPSTQLGGTLTLQSRLVLARPGAEPRSPLAPHRPGSVLWSDELRLVLEGEGQRFPILPLDFVRAGVGGGRASSGWCLEGAETDPTASGVGSLRLLLNVTNPAIRQLLEDPSSPASTRLAQLIQYDVGRQLVMTALHSEEISDGIAYEAGTLGDLVTAIVRRAFDNRALDTLRGEYRDAPGDFEAELQARLRLLDVPA